MKVQWDCSLDAGKVTSDRILDKMRTIFSTEFDGFLLTRSTTKGYGGRGTLICCGRFQTPLDLEEATVWMEKAAVNPKEDCLIIRHSCYWKDHIRITYDSVLYFAKYTMHCATLNVFPDGRFTFRNFNQSRELELVLSALTRFDDSQLCIKCTRASQLRRMKCAFRKWQKFPAVANETK